MSQIHFGVAYDTETGEFTQVDLQEMPVESKECVWDAELEAWRRPTLPEINVSFLASSSLNEMLRPA